MKQTVRLILCALGIIGAVSIWLWVVISVCKPNSQPNAYYAPDYVESYTVGSFDQLQICKVYYLFLEGTPDCIPTEDFKKSGYCFSLLELTKECCDGTDIYTAVFRESGSCIMK